MASGGRQKTDIWRSAVHRCDSGRTGLDGRNGGEQRDVLLRRDLRLATAMTGFLNSSANVSGLAPGDMAVLIQKLNNSSGKI
jgi:hypothetical protein